MAEKPEQATRLICGVNFFDLPSGQLGSLYFSTVDICIY